MNGDMGSDVAANDGSTWAKAKKTIAAAATLALTGDEIWVAGATCAERVTDTKGLAFYGGCFGDEASRNARHGSASLIQGNGAHATVRLHAGTVNRAVLDSFTVSGGTFGVSWPGFNVVRNCLVTGNGSTTSNGGGPGYQGRLANQTGISGNISADPKFTGPGSYSLGGGPRRRSPATAVSSRPAPRTSMAARASRARPWTWEPMNRRSWP